MCVPPFDLSPGARREFASSVRILGNGGQASGWSGTPTIADLEADGVAGVDIPWIEFAYDGSETGRFEARGQLDEMIFPKIKAARRFACSIRRSQNVALTPDWPARGRGALRRKIAKGPKSGMAGLGSETAPCPLCANISD